MSKETEENIKKELGSVMTADGELKVIKNFSVKTENRQIILGYLEDETTIITVKRFKESEENPYTELITEQIMRLSKLTIFLLTACLLKGNVDFGIDSESIIEELKKKDSNKADS
jgi:hypothetical protein